MSSDNKLHPEWDAEIRKRLAEIESGQVKLIDASEVFKRLKNKKDDDG